MDTYNETVFDLFKKWGTSNSPQHLTHNILYFVQK